MGIEVMGGMYDVVIEANSTIPTKKSKVYSTAADNQPSVEIHILQGERPMARDNRPIGRFILGDIPPAPRGVPQIEVSFDIDANGILSVSAMDKGTGKQQSIRIEASTGLSKEEIEKMKAEAAANADTDKAARERQETLNEADSLIFQTEKQLKEFGEKIPADKKSVIEDALSQLKTAHAAQDIDGIKKHKEAVTNAFMAASQDIYSAQQAGGAGAGTQDFAENGGGSTSNTSDDITDVEFEEVKDKK
jgi:molecular chaperone DnaK